MNKSLQVYVLFILMPLTTTCVAQHYYRAKDKNKQRWSDYLTDTLRFSQTRIDTVTSLNDLRANYKIVDSISNPDGFIFKIAENVPGTVILGKANFILAIKKESLFLTFPILGWNSNEDIQIERINFGDTIEKKLLIHQSFNYGFSFTADGDAYRELYQECELWDLREIKLILGFRNYYSYKRWDDYKVTTQECLCENFQIEFASPQIRIKEMDVCDKYSEALKKRVKVPYIFTYYWTGKELIKKK